MAVSTLASPASYTPAYNPQWFLCSSSQSAQPNFRYRLVITDIISGESVTKDVDADPSGYLKYDNGSFAEQYIEQVNPANLYGWQLNTGAVRKIRVNVGEVYGATPTYYAGSNTDYIVWNGSLDLLSNTVRDMQNYVYTDYKYSQANNIQLITNNRNEDYTWSPSSNPEHYSNPETVTANRSSYLTFLCSASGDVEKIRVIGYDASGNSLGSTLIGNINYSGGTTYTNKYFFIDVGYDGLNNMPSGSVLSGTYPIPVSTYDYWIVYDESSWLPTSTPPAQPYVYPLKRYNLVCEPRFDVITLHYLTPEGNFETQAFNKLSLRTTEANKTYYSKLPYSISQDLSGITYTYGSQIENSLSSTSKDKMTINTGWLEEYEVEQLKDIISAPIVYADEGNSRGYLAVKVLTNSLKIEKKYNSKLLSVSLDIEYTFTNVRQRG